MAVAAPDRKQGCLLGWTCRAVDSLHPTAHSFQKLLRKRRVTDLSLRFISNRLTWPPERSYSARSAVATKSSVSLSVLNVGIAFLIIPPRSSPTPSPPVRCRVPSEPPPSPSPPPPCS